MSKKPFRRIRLIYRRSPLLVKCVVLAAIVLSTAALLAMRMAITQANAQTDALRQQAASLEQENARLEEAISELDTVQGIRDIATEKLGLVDPGTVFFRPVESDTPN